MAAQKGSSFLLKDNSTGTPATIGGLRATSMTVNGEIVDVTTKDSSVFVSSGNDIGREILTGGGITSMSISASGVFVDSATDENVRDAAFKGEVNDYQLVFGNADTIDGSFKITSYERSGEFNGEETYSITLESSGQITFTAG